MDIRIATQTGKSLCSIANIVVGGRNGGVTSGQRSGLGPRRPAGAGGRVRSTHHLVKSNACRVLGTLGRPLQRTGDFGARPPPVRQLRAGERQNAQSLVDWTAKTDIDHDQAVKDTRAGAIELPILRSSDNRLTVGSTKDSLGQITSFTIMYRE